MEKSLDVEGELYYTIILGLGIGLHQEHDFEDDMGIQFSNYQYYINFDYIRSSFLHDYSGEWNTSVATVIADMLSLNLHCECLFVRNLSEIINRFTPGEQIFMPYPKGS
jgi:hypothetical protein